MVILHNYIWPACSESLIYSVGNTYIDNVYMVFLVSPESSYGQKVHMACLRRVHEMVAKVYFDSTCCMLHITMSDLVSVS